MNIAPSPPKSADDVNNVQLLSSIRADAARFTTQTQQTTINYVNGGTSRQEVVTNVVTQENGRPPVQPTQITLDSDSGFETETQLTTYTYLNTFADAGSPVVITSSEVVTNVATVPAGSRVPTGRKFFDTNTYLRTYTFTKNVDNLPMTSQEVVTQVVVTEAPTSINVQPTEVDKLTKTYLNTVTLTTTVLEGSDSVVRQITTVVPEVVVETLNDFEATPVIESSKTEEPEIPILATKTYFTTSTHYTTLLRGSETIVQSRKEVVSSVVTETIQGFDEIAASLFSDEPSIQAPNTRPTYIQLGSNLYGKLKTLLATATYFVTNSAGEVTSKQLVVPQITTETVSLSSPPQGAYIEPSRPIPPVEVTDGPSLILNAAQLEELKQSFLSSNQPSSSITDPTELPVLETSATPGLEPSDGSTSGATVIMVTNTDGEVLILPTEILGENTSTSTTSTSTSSSQSVGGTLASILSNLGTLGLTALGHMTKNNPDVGVNINLGPVLDAMTGILSNSFMIMRRNDTNDRNRTDADNNPLNRLDTLQPASVVRKPPREEPIFIPIGGLAGNPVAPAPAGGPAANPQSRRPGPQSPLIPLLRPSGSRPPLPNSNNPAVRVNITPSLQTGFTAITSRPVGPQSSRLPIRFPNVPNRPQAPPSPSSVLFTGQNNIDRLTIQPAPPSRGALSTSQFFAANGQQINVPPLPVAPPPPGPGPQEPVQAIGDGAIVIGPDGNPVVIVKVAEGETPPPGAGGKVFIRPNPAPVPVSPQPPLLPPRRTETIFFPGQPRPQRPLFQVHFQSSDDNFINCLFVNNLIHKNTID